MGSLVDTPTHKERRADHSGESTDRQAEESETGIRTLNTKYHILMYDICTKSCCVCTYPGIYDICQLAGLSNDENRFPNKVLLLYTDLFPLCSRHSSSGDCEPIIFFVCIISASNAKAPSYRQPHYGYHTAVSHTLLLYRLYHTSTVMIPYVRMILLLYI